MGIVPVYAGAEDITDYIPKKCFVDYFSFKNDDELAKYLLSMGEEEYQCRLESIKDLLKTDIKEKFSGEEYARCMLRAVSHQKKYETTLYGRLYVNSLCLKENIIETLKYIKTILIKSKK